MIIAGFVMLGFVVAGVALGTFAYFSAPVGYQDETGFHFGAEKSATSLEVRHVKAA